MELEAEGVAPTRAACLERFNAKRQEMGLEPVSKTTFAAYTRKGGILPHRVNAQEGCVLYRPTEGVGGDSA